MVCQYLQMLAVIALHLMCPTADGACYMYADPICSEQKEQTK